MSVCTAVRRRRTPSGPQAPHRSAATGSPTRTRRRNGRPRRIRPPRRRPRHRSGPDDVHRRPQPAEVPRGSPARPPNGLREPFAAPFRPWVCPKTRGGEPALNAVPQMSNTQPPTLLSPPVDHEGSRRRCRRKPGADDAAARSSRTVPGTPKKTPHVTLTLEQPPVEPGKPRPGSLDRRGRSAQDPLPAPAEPHGRTVPLGTEAARAAPLTPCSAIS